MRVLHLDTGRDMRGGQWQVLRLIQGLLEHGIDCRLLARNRSPLFAQALERGWNVEPFSAARLAIESRRADIVHAHDARAHTFAALAGGAPLVVARRVAFPVRSRWKYRRAARYVAVSHFVAGVLENGGVEADRISVVYDGVPLLDPAPQKTGVIAPANADDSQKGADLAAAAARIAGLHVTISGDLVHDLPGAAIFLYLTRSEGLGSAALLAMAAGTAVVASRTGGLLEVVEDGVTGYLVDNRPPQIAEVIRQLVAYPALALAMGERGRCRIAERFSVDRMVSDTVEVYRLVTP